MIAREYLAPPVRMLLHRKCNVKAGQHVNKSMSGIGNVGLVQPIKSNLHPQTKYLQKR